MPIALKASSEEREAHDEKIISYDRSIFSKRNTSKCLFDNVNFAKAKAVGFALEIEKKNFSKSKSTIGFQVLVVKLCLLIKLSDIFLIFFDWCLNGKSLKISGIFFKKFPIAIFLTKPQ